MNANEYYQKAKKWQQVGTCLFLLNAILSICLIYLKDTSVERLFIALLCLVVIGSVLISIRTRCLTNDGNAAQRSAQFADAFGVACEHPARDGYYNNSLRPGLRRLLATTCESAGLTRKILNRMVVGEGIKFTIFLGVFIAYNICLKTDSSIVAIAAQTLFSGELAVNIYVIMRYSAKAYKAQETLLNLFRTSVSLDDPDVSAIGLSAHVDYECAKEEAAILLDSKIYEQLNPDYTKQWNNWRTGFKVDL